jgi:hypothetical protein
MISSATRKLASWEALAFLAGRLLSRKRIGGNALNCPVVNGGLKEIISK